MYETAVAKKRRGRVHDDTAESEFVSFLRRKASAYQDAAIQPTQTGRAMRLLGIV